MFHGKFGGFARVIPLLLLLPFFASCVTSQSHQRALDEKDKTISDLREERTQLKSQLQALANSRDEALGELADASARPAPAVHETAAEKTDFSELDAVGVGHSVRNGNVVISIPSSITFRSGKADLSDSGRKALQKVAATLKREYPDARFSVEGHTDADPINKSSFASNRDLSVARAMAVLRYLVEDCSVADDRCIVAGYGQYDPVASNSKDTDKAKNRRVEIVVLRKRG
jgi:chemotaxis protein MotB